MDFFFQSKFVEGELPESQNSPRRMTTALDSSSDVDQAVDSQDRQDRTCLHSQDWISENDDMTNAPSNSTGRKPARPGSNESFPEAFNRYMTVERRRLKATATLTDRRAFELSRASWKALSHAEKQKW